MLTKTQQQFVKWMRVNEPRLYRAAASAAGSATGNTSVLSAADTGQPAGGSWWDSFIGAAKQLVPVAIQARSQKRILDVQLRRAEQGLPPLQTSQIAPTVNVQAGVTPDLKKILIPALAIGGGLLLYFMFGKKGR